MASKAFLQVAGNIGKSKNVETVIVGTSHLGEGAHDVTIQAVDTSKIDENKLGVTYIDGEGKTYTDLMFVLSSDQTEFSYGLRALWSALIPDKGALGTLIQMATEDDKAFEIFTGMKLRITLAPGKGVQARTTGLGKFAGFDVESNEKVTEEYDDIKSVYAEVKGRALKRSYLRVVKSEATNSEGNIAQFNAAVTAKTPPVVEMKFAPGV